MAIEGGSDNRFRFFAFQSGSVLFVSEFAFLCFYSKGEAVLEFNPVFFFHFVCPSPMGLC